MRENLLKKQPTWWLRRAQGTGQKSATPATLTKVILVLLTMLLLPLGAWAENYPITVAGIQVTDENAANVLNDVETATVSFTPASGDNPATLTLNGATIDMSAIPGLCPIESSIANLTIQLIGRYNKLIPNSDNINGIRFTDGTTTGNLTFTTSNVVEEYGLLSVEGIYQFSDLTSGYNVTNSFTTGEQTGWSKIESGIPNATNKNVKIDYIAYYDVWVGGARMSSSSLSPVSGGTKYIPSTHTLHLAGYGYSDEIKSGLPEFIVEVSGSNNSVSNITFEGNTPGTIIFKKDESSPTGNNMVEFTGSVKGFSSVTITPPLQLVSPSGVDNPTSAQWNSFTNVSIADFTTTYDITVGGKNVTNANASDILGDGTVSYDSENNILTLNDATIIPESKKYGITYTGTTDLVISLKGTSNVVKGVGGCPAIGYFNNDVQTAPSLTFTNGSETDPCKLQLESVSTATIGGFGSVVNTGLYKIDETILGADQENIYQTTITSTLLSGGSGTSAHPFIVGTADDLKNFAKYVNDGILSTEYIKLGGNIDCTNLTGFEPIGNNTSFIGTFNGDGNSITGLIFSNTDQDGVAGLFGNIGKFNNTTTEITRGTVKNLTLSGCQFGNGARNGAIAGNLAYGTIENCTVTSCTISSGNSQSTFSGGIAGIIEVEGVVKDCVVNDGTITSSTSDTSDGEVCAGGIVAEASGSSEINGCTVTDVSINSTCNRGHNSYSGGIVGSSQATISGNSVEGTTTVNSINNENNETYAGAIVANKTGGLLTENYYDFTVKTKTTIGNNDPVEKSDYTQRGIGQDIGQENGSYDIPNQVMMAGTKKVNISVTDLSSGRTLSLSDDMESTYYLEEYDDSSEPLKALYVLPNNNVSLIVSSENGYKPTFALSDNDVTVTTTPEFENDFWTIKYDFKMPEDDVTATIAFAIDLGSQLYTLETDQEAYPYTGEGIEPSISLTISTDQQDPVTLSKDTDFEIQKYMKDVDGVFTPIFEEDGKTPKTPVDAGSYQVYISGIGSYTGEAVLEFSITKATTDECIWFYHLVDGKEEQVLSVEEATYGTAYDAPKLKNPLNLAVTLSCNAENGSNGTASDVATIDDEGNITILKAGTVYVYAVTEGNENYEAGEVHYQLDIEKGSLENVTITEIDDQVYTGTAIEPELAVTTPDGTSVTTDDYVIGYTPDNTNVGQVTITLTAKEGSEKFTESTTTTFNIIPPTPTIAFDNTKTYLNTDKIAISIDEAYATSSATAGITNTIYYSWDKNPVTGTEYPEGGVAAQTGTLTAWVSATKSGATYESEKTTQAFTVKKDIASCTVTPEEATYTGEAIELVVKASETGTTATTLTEGTDYTVSYQKVEGETATEVESMIDAGTYKITITGIGNYGGTSEVENFQISQASLEDAAISKLIVGDKEYEYDPDKDIEIPYTGEAIQPEVVVLFNDGTVTVDPSEYTVSYGNNTEVSNETAIASVTVTSTNKNFTGGTSTSLEFKIVPALVTITAAAQTVTYNAEQQAYTGASVNNENAALVISYYTSEEERTTGSNALAGAPTDAGTYYVSVTLNAKSLQHYTAEPANVTFTIAQLDISDAVITLDYEELTYNGKEQSVTVEKVMVGDIEVAADYYEVSGNSGTEVDNYTVTVTAKTKNSEGSDFKNNFKGTATAKFNIVNRSVTLEELGLNGSQPSCTYYSNSEDLEVPDGIVAYIITGINGNSVTTQRVSYIPKGVAVYVEKTTSSEEPSDEISNTDQLPLKGTQEAKDVTSITGGTVYVLYNGEFVKSTSGTIPAHRCYLLVATNVASGTRSFGIDHGDGTTSLREVKGEKWADGEWYTLQGQRIAKPAKGLYILNGKKVVIK